MNIFKKIYYWNRNTIYFPLLRFFDTKLTKNHLICVKESFNAMPYDYSYLWRVEKVHLIEMRDYFKISHITNHENDIKYIDICIKLLDILIDDGYDLYDTDKNVFKKCFCSAVKYSKEDSSSSIGYSALHCGQERRLM